LRIMKKINIKGVAKKIIIPKNDRLKNFIYFYRNGLKYS